MDLKFTMFNGIKMSKFSLQYWAQKTLTAFQIAAEHLDDHVEPIFKEAAEGESSGGIIPLTQGRFDSALISKVMGNSMADNTSNRLLKKTKAGSERFTQKNLGALQFTFIK